MDFDIQFDVPNHNYNVSSKFPNDNSHSSIDQRLFSGYEIGPRYKVRKTKSRSLSG